MAEIYERPYVDSNVYIALLKGTKKEPVKAELAAEILHLAETGQFNVYASTFIEAEVIKAPGETSPLTPGQESTIATYFENDWIVWLEVDRLIAQEARRVARDFGMKPPDAVHVATALKAGCDQFLTWDEKLHKNEPNGRVVDGVTICEPHLTGRPARLWVDDAQS
jgi:predicted nucleic acid-binding protein